MLTCPIPDPMSLTIRRSSHPAPTGPDARHGPRRTPRSALPGGRVREGSERFEVVELLLRVVLVALVAAAAEHLGAGGHRRLPVEDDRVLLLADDDLVARLGAGLHQPPLDTEAREP